MKWSPEWWTLADLIFWPRTDLHLIELLWPASWTAANFFYNCIFPKCYHPIIFLSRNNKTFIMFATIQPKPLPLYFANSKNRKHIPMVFSWKQASTRVPCLTSGCREWWREFMMDCPDGMLTREKVLEMLLYILPRLCDRRNITTSFSYLEKMDKLSPI